VLVDDVTVGEIGRGLLLLVGVAVDDDLTDVDVVVRKVVGYEEGKMNRSVSDIGGSVLVVSQFTLLGSVRKGRRPSFTNAARPDDAVPLMAALCAGLRQHGIMVAEGEFGAQMRVELVNDGPVTIVLDVVDGQVV